MIFSACIYILEQTGLTGDMSKIEQQIYTSYFVTAFPLMNPVNHILSWTFTGAPANIKNVCILLQNMFEGDISQYMAKVV